MAMAVQVNSNGYLLTYFCEELFLFVVSEPQIGCLEERTDSSFLLTIRFVL